VARGHLNDDVEFYTGKGPDGKPVNEFPFPVTKDVIERGEAATTSIARRVTAGWAMATEWWSGAASASRRRTISNACGRSPTDISST
jgi:hypothetical protein